MQAMQFDKKVMRKVKLMTAIVMRITPGSLLMSKVEAFQTSVIIGVTVNVLETFWMLNFAWTSIKIKAVVSQILPTIFTPGL